MGPADIAIYRQARRHLPMAGIEPTVPAASPWQTFVGPVDTAIYRQARIHLSMAGIEPTGCSGHLALPLPFVTLFKQRESNVTDIMTRTRRLYLNNRLNSHMYKLKWAASPKCSCGQDNQTAERFLQQRPLLEQQRKAVSPVESGLRLKLYGAMKGYEDVAGLRL